MSRSLAPFPAGMQGNENRNMKAASTECADRAAISSRVISCPLIWTALGYNLSAIVSGRISLEKDRMARRKIQRH
ncbi:hypothetical protein N7501_003371 [Penicillium viridicatum]|nr:hypothetical protein N7501_003371 [Penicillium viridicatum]